MVRISLIPCYTLELFTFPPRKASLSFRGSIVSVALSLGSLPVDITHYPGNGENSPLESGLSSPENPGLSPACLEIIRTKTYVNLAFFNQKVKKKPVLCWTGSNALLVRLSTNLSFLWKNRPNNDSFKKQVIECPPASAVTIIIPI